MESIFQMKMAINQNTVQKHAVNVDDWFMYKEPLYIDGNGHLYTKQRHLVVKDGVNNNRAVSKKQLDFVDKQLQRMVTTSFDSNDKKIDNSIALLTNTINNNKSASETVVNNSITTMKRELTTLINGSISQAIKSTRKGNYSLH